MKQVLGIFLFLLAITSQAQDFAVTGSVTDGSDGLPIPGVSVIVKGTTNGTITDFDGQYHIMVNQGDILVFSFIGLTSQEIEVTSDVIQVVLKSTTENIDEVVVVGYGTMKKKLVTGANLNMKGEELEALSTANAMDAMKGISPGLNIVSNTAQPGAGSKVYIRGVGTTGDSQPLYLVDGVIQSNIDYLSTSDIESIDVLKDAASAAIYGARAANGVILVTTKKGKKNMKTTVTYDGYYGVQNVRKSPDLLNAQEYALIIDEGLINSGLPLRDYASLVPDWDKIQSGESQGTNWFEEASVNNAAIQNHSVNIAGGSEKSVFSLGYSYFEQDGVMGKQSNSYYKRNTIRFNNEYTILANEHRDIIKVGQNFTYANTKSNSIRQGDQYWNDVSNFVSTSPLLPLYNAQGEYHNAIPWNPEEANPIALMDYTTRNGENDNNTIVGSAYVNIEPIENLVIRSEIGINSWFGGSRRWVPSYNLSNTVVQPTDAISQSLNHGRKYMWSNTATYDFKVGDGHNFTVMGGNSIETTTLSYSMTTNGQESLFQDWQHGYISNATDIVSATGRDDFGDALMSYFGRFAWNYNETYMLSGLVRADGSSKFAAGNRWGVFPSLSAGWVLSNEAFMEGLSDVLSFAKLRASWGQVGNNSIDDFLYAPAIGYTAEGGAYYNASYGFGSNKGTPGSTSSTRLVGSYPTGLPNEDIKWETSQQVNIGLDFHFLNSKLQGAVDWYKKDTKDWLVWTSVPSHNGLSGQMVNGGAVTNQGVEASLRWNDNIGRDFKYGVTLSYSHNKNEVTSIANTEGIIHGPSNVLSEGTSSMFRAQEGYPIGYFWGYETDGIIQNEAEADAWVGPEGNKYFADQKPGDYRFVDTDGNGVIDEKDKVMIGNPNPDHILGLQINAEYKGVYLNVTGNGAFGHQIMKSYRAFATIPLQNYTTDIFDRWHGEGTSTTRPRLDYVPTRNTTEISDHYIQDADFFKISNITFGYDFSRVIKNIPYFSGVKVYTTLQDFFVFTKYDGMDPEVGYGPTGYQWASGIDLGLYPTARTVLFGVNLTF